MRTSVGRVLERRGRGGRTRARGSSARPSCAGAAHVLGACATLAFACSEVFAQQAPQTVLAPAGEQARSIGGLWWFFFYVLSAVWVLVVAATLFAIVKGRGRKAGSEETPGEPEVE